MTDFDANRFRGDLHGAVGSSIHFDKQHQGLYATDASNYRFTPIAVLFPRTSEEVVKATEVCRHYQIPIVCRGGGTGLAGQTVNHAEVIDFAARKRVKRRPSFGRRRDDLALGRV